MVRLGTHSVIERAELVTPRLQMRALDFYPDSRLLRSTWRGLETELRLGLHGHERGNLGYRQGQDLMDHRASPRPYQVGAGHADSGALLLADRVGEAVRGRARCLPRRGGPSRDPKPGHGDAGARSQVTRILRKIGH